MIFELIRRDIAWKVLPWFILVSVVVCACPAPVSEFGVMAALMGLFVAFPHVHATRFQAGLPIEGRDLILARALSIMAMVWLPAAAGAVAALSVGHSLIAGRALIVAALCTLAGGAAQSTRIRELTAPKWGFIAPWVLIPLTGMYLARHRASALIPAACAVAGIALLARTWSVVPKSFELAPAKPRAGDGPARLVSPAAAVSPRFVWLPVMRSVFTAPNVMFLGFLVFFATGTLRLALCMWIVFGWLMARRTTLWLRPLPVRTRTLLIAILAPILLALSLGYAGSFRLHLNPKPVPTLQILILDLGALLGWALAVILVTALGDWRRLTHISRKVRLIVFGVLMGVPFVGGIGGSVLLHGVDPLHKAVLRLAQALPDSLALAVALVAVVLAALWWALEKVFAEADCADKPCVQKDEYFA